MTTYLLITSDKPTELTAFVGPDRPLMYFETIETAKASRLPVVNANLVQDVDPWVYIGSDIRVVMKLDTPVELEGWEVEKTYQILKKGGYWEHAELTFKELEAIDFVSPSSWRQAYRLKRSERITNPLNDFDDDIFEISKTQKSKVGCYEKDLKRLEPVKDFNSFCEKGTNHCKMNYCDENGCLERKRFLTEPNESPIESKTQEGPSDNLQEAGLKRMAEIYPLANEEDFPDQPNVNKINHRCRSAFMNGLRFAESWKSPESHKTQESQILTHKEEILRFLLGEGKLDGYSFGDRPFDKGAYWWRIQLRKAFKDILTRRNP